MFDLSFLIQKPFLFGFFIFGIVLIRYLLFAGLAYLIVWKRKWSDKFRIRQIYPDQKIILYEFLNSIHTFIYFALTGSFISYLYNQGLTQIYMDFDRFGGLYFTASIFLALIVHDTYFYWTHRFMHLKKIFPYFHKVHHKSVNPSPWAAFSFHPLESIVEAGILPLLVLLFPLHPYALSIFLAVMTLLNVEGHLGYEFYPKGFTRHFFWKYFNTSTHHNMHHQFFSCNYGLYFNWWDQIMKTNHKNYHSYFKTMRP
ncbi:MAG: sterol desaturase family protein [Spirochaetia bacterium]|nr:sterol desaturase family protein [Spirochaetia bacterium]